MNIDCLIYLQILSIVNQYACVEVNEKVNAHPKCVF